MSPPSRVSSSASAGYALNGEKTYCRRGQILDRVLELSLACPLTLSIGTGWFKWRIGPH